MDNKLQKKIDKRKKEGALRSLSLFEGMTDFVSNDYLGFKGVTYKSCDNEASTGSRLISGNNSKIEKAELKIAAFFGWENGLCFNSGYDANLGIFSSIPQKGDVVIYDEHIHASVRDGVRLSNAKSYAFKHNDVNDLERLIQKFPTETIYIAVEGIYSMHGDLCPLNNIVKFVDSKRIFLIVDEAHSCGVVGENGKGLTAMCDVDSKIYIKLVTYGKAYGGHGACILTDNETKEYLVNFARSFIYTTALPTNAYIYMSEIINHSELDNRIDLLNENIGTFREAIPEHILLSSELSPIQVIRAEVAVLEEVKRELLLNNFSVKLVLPPTVKEGDECIRVCIHASNTKMEIKNFASIIADKLDA